MLRGSILFSMGMIGGCLRSSGCQTKIKVQFVSDHPRPGYEQELAPIQFESLPSLEQQFVTNCMDTDGESENRMCTRCAESNRGAQRFCNRVEEKVTQQDGSPWGGAPHVYLIRNQRWYDIWLKKGGEIISI